MRINSRDDTLKKNTIQKVQFLIQDDELVKQGKHPLFKRVKDFYTHHGTCPQTLKRKQVNKTHDHRKTPHH